MNKSLIFWANCTFSPLSLLSKTASAYFVSATCYTTGVMKRLVRFFSVILIALNVVPSAYAAIIIDQSQTSNNGTWSTLNSSIKTNQSFTAGANNIAGAGIYLTSFSSGPFTGTMTLEIWDGLSGTGGTMLASGTTSTAPTQADSWVDIFWTPESLSVGNTYYLRPTGDTATGYGFGSGDPYAGGSMFRDNGNALVSGDLMFRTYYDSTIVPVPAAVWLFGSGLVGLVAMARRKKT